jgi:hypothetical protein
MAAPGGFAGLAGSADGIVVLMISRSSANLQARLILSHSSFFCEINFVTGI